MDPFEVRLQFVSLLTRLNSSLHSISKCTSFAILHSQRCHEDIWDCLVEETRHANLNHSINLLFLVDHLLDMQSNTHNTTITNEPYTRLANRDIAMLVDLVVPDTPQGSLNLMSATQVVTSWKTRRVFDHSIVDPILSKLAQRKQHMRQTHTQQNTDDTTNRFADLSRNDILRRIEDDRERHKRLRERIWVLPVPTTLTTISHVPFSHSLTASSPVTIKPSPTSPASPSEPLTTSTKPVKTTRTKQLASSNMTTTIKPSSTSTPQTLTNSNGQNTATNSDQSINGPGLPIEIEFDQLWEARLDSQDQLQNTIEVDLMKSDQDQDDKDDKMKRKLNSIDRLSMKQERLRCFVNV
ncbi:hypothetical protein OIO90_001217 [Microbotryomycetes sp. JL221]|nr:hypothetical protein OIO90_001217 [Microbotryomycetes sp. JL221]